MLKYFIEMEMPRLVLYLQEAANDGAPANEG